MTVAKYESKFTELSRFATHITDDEIRKAQKFERGLRPAIRSRILALKLQAYADVVERALIIERDLEEIQEIRDKKDKKFISKSKRGNESETSYKRIKISKFEKEKVTEDSITCKMWVNKI